MLTLSSDFAIGNGSTFLAKVRTTLRFESASTRPGITWVKGRNGVGKSTLFRTLCGLQKPHAGTIEWHHPPAPAITFVAEELDFIGTFTIQDLISVFDCETLISKNANNSSITEPFVIHLQKIVSSSPLPKFVSSAPKFLSALQWDLPLNKPFQKLSFGTKQKVRFLCALLSAPQTELMILDEPLLGLDIESRQSALAFLKFYCAENKKRILLSGHESDLPSDLYDSILEIHEGDIRFVPTLNPSATIA